MTRILAIAVVLLSVAAIIVVLTLLTRAEQQTLHITIDAPASIQDRMIELEERAIDAAFQEHITILFQGWLKDSAGQPQRARQGIERAQRAYVQAMNGVTRERERLKQARDGPK